MRLITLDEYITMPRPDIYWLVKEMVPKPSFILVIGAPKSGKSTLALQLASCVAKGAAFMGRPVMHTSKTIYIQFDMSEFEWRYVLTQMQNGGAELALSSITTFHPDEPLTPMNILDRGKYQMLTDAVAMCPEANIVVLDVLREMHDGDEDNSGVMKIVGDALMQLVKGRTLILLHHTRKLPPDVDLSAIDPVQEARGSSYLAGKAGAVWLVHDNSLIEKGRFAPKRVVPMYRHPQTGLWTMGRA